MERLELTTCAEQGGSNSHRLIFEQEWGIRSELLPTSQYLRNGALAMTFLFILCAVLGGTILVCQFVLTLVGFGHDVGDMVHDGSVELHTDVHVDAHTGDTHNGDH